MIGWIGIARLGLVQACLGGLAVIATSTLNRVMTVELAWPALGPGLLVALHYAVQALRPALGHRSDRGGRRTPLILGGMALLAAGVTGAAAAVAAMGIHPHAAVAVAGAVVAYGAIGLGVGASGTGVLVLLAERTAEPRRGAAASVAWMCMIAGIALTASLIGRGLDPFSWVRLIWVCGVAGIAAMAITAAAVLGVERGPALVRPAAPPAERFGAALRAVLTERRSRALALFVFVSMLAYAAQELVLEPFAGFVAGLSPGQSAGLTGLQHQGVLIGMLAAAFGSARGGGARLWTVGGCLCSAAALIGLAALPVLGGLAWLRPTVAVLGAANGAFAVAAIGAMMHLAAAARDGQAGLRMGLFGAAQAWAFGAGGLLGAGASDAARSVFGAPGAAYAAVFTAEAGLFALAAWQATRLFAPPRWAGSETTLGGFQGEPV